MRGGRHFERAKMVQHVLLEDCRQTRSVTVHLFMKVCRSCGSLFTVCFIFGTLQGESAMGGAETTYVRGTGTFNASLSGTR